jgi:serine/threonine protein kinase
MADPISLEPRLEPDLQALGGGASRREDLPRELKEDLARRLRFAGLLICILAPISFAATSAVAGLLPLEVRIVRALATVTAGALVAWIAGRRGSHPDRLLMVGSAFAVFIALTLALTSVPATWFASSRAGFLWSPVAVWVLVFPLIVPGTRRRTLVTAVLAAATEPLVVLGLVYAGRQPMPSGQTFLLNAWPNLLAIVLALVVSSTVYRLGERLARARAMGSYQLVRLLGRGGMGEVWLARHRLLAREAALKIIQPSALGSASVAEATDAFRRFEREAQATAALRSPHTVELYDFGIAADGTFYYVMELLDGIDLDRLVEQDGPLPPERCVYILQQACHSLYEAHVRGLVHRDVKPANIFLCRHGTDLDFVKLLDFGLVRQRHRGERGEAEAAAAGKLSGTPAFLAPETLTGSGAVDGRADLYGLGCVAYWLLTGRLVFERVSSMEMAVAHATAAPVPIQQRVREPIPEGLADLVMRCLEKEPHRRPPSARHLADELDRLGLAPRWTEARRAEWWNARRSSAAGVGASSAATRSDEAPTVRLVRPRSEPPGDQKT